MRSVALPGPVGELQRHLAAQIPALSRQDASGAASACLVIADFIKQHIEVRQMRIGEILYLRAFTTRQWLQALHGSGVLAALVAALKRHALNAVSPDSRQLVVTICALIERIGLVFGSLADPQVLSDATGTGTTVTGRIIVDALADLLITVDGNLHGWFWMCDALVSSSRLIVSHHDCKRLDPAGNSR